MLTLEGDENDDENVWNASAVILDIDSGVLFFCQSVSVFDVNLSCERGLNLLHLLQNGFQSSFSCTHKVLLYAITDG